MDQNLTGDRTLTVCTLKGQTLYFTGGYLGAAPGQPVIQLVVPRKGKGGSADGFAPYGDHTHAAYATDALERWWFVRYHEKTGRAKAWRCKLPNYSRLPRHAPRMGAQARSKWGYLPELKRNAVAALEAACTEWQLPALRARCDLI